MRQAFWTRDALRDFAEIDDYYAELDAEFASRVGDLAVAAALFLLERPAAGPVIDIGNARKWRVAKTPYLLIYRPVAEGIYILRVRHVREDWKPRR